MSAFKAKLDKAAQDAANLPSFPVKGTVYHLNFQAPDFSAHDDWQKQVNNFGKTVERKQTVYYVNTREGILRISPNQCEQLQKLLAPLTIDPAQTWLPIATIQGEQGLVFELAPEFEKEVKYTRKDA